VLLFSAILLTTKKTKFKGFLFILIMRGMFGPYTAITLPDLDGLDLPYEIELFFIEHILGIIGPLVLVLFGNRRYGFFRGESVKVILV
jgi:uncharacterized membrane protein YwaF